MAFSTDFPEFAVHTVTSEPYAGSGRNGDVFGAAVPVVGWLSEQQKLVRTEAGVEVTASSTFTCDPAYLATFPVNSRVTLPGDRKRRVISVAQHTSGALDLPDHLTVAIA